MKKIFKLIIPLVVILTILSACASEKTRVFTRKQQGITTEVVFYYKGDKVTKQTAKNILVYSELGVTKEQLKEKIDQYVDKYKGIEGVEDKLEYQDTQMIEHMTIDYTKAKVNELKGVPGIAINAEDGQGISMKKSAEMAEKSGFTEKK